MALSNTATPIYYGRFREAVIRGEIPVCREVSMEMNRIDDLIANPGIYYDDKAVEGFVKFCENELTLTDGGELKLLGRRDIWLVLLCGPQYLCAQSRRTWRSLRAKAHQETAYHEAVSYHSSRCRQDHV